ncbi:MAG TPA: ABC transporter ATP-binding protein [Candidatus Thermoplasmatota archaeon]|nr:ABC transporter ATP-binding protein [Candidatus Thermoplasmatota archaeon]
MSNTVIELNGLTKRYGASRGVDNVSLEVQQGEVFGFLGPNGAGKTTTIRLLLDLLRPTSGHARLFGLDARAGSREIHARTGYLPGELGLAERMTVGQQLEYFGNLRGGVPRARVEALATRLDLDLVKPVRSLSRGNKQKVGIVQAFMHEPELLILDEPTGGLDPLMQQEFNALVKEAAAAGATVFLSSHILPEVETLCDRVGIIREGQLVAAEDVATVRQRAVRRIAARYRRAPVAKLVADLPGVAAVRVEGGTLHCTVQGDTGPAVRALATEDLLDLTVGEPSLEDVFLGYYGRGRSQ